MYDPKKEKLAMDYIANNPNPDQSLCPRLIVEYKGCNQKYGNYMNYYVPTSGQKFINNHPYEAVSHSIWRLKNGEREIYVNPNTLTAAVYTKYIPELDAVEISKIYMKNGRPDRKLNADIRKWSYIDGVYGKLESTYNEDKNLYWLCRWYDKMPERNRVILFRNDVTPYGAEGLLWQEEDGRYYNHEFVRYLHSFSKYFWTDCSAQQLRLFYNGSKDFVTEDSSENYRGIWSLEDKYKNLISRAVSEKAKAKLQSATDSVTTKLTDVEAIQNKYKTWYFNYSSLYASTGVGQTVEHGFFVAEPANDNLVIRCFKRVFPVGSSTSYPRTVLNKMQEGEVTEINEVGRIVFDKKGEVTYFDVKPTKITPVKKYYGAVHYTHGPLRNPEEVIKFFPETKVFFDSINPATSGNFDFNVESLKQMLKNPVVLKLYEEKYTELAKFCTSNSTKGELSLIFGVELTSSKKKQADLCTALGMNKYQLQKFNEQLGKRDKFGSPVGTRALADLKFMADKHDISGLSNEDFDTYFEKIVSQSELSGNWVGDFICTRYYWDYGYGFKRRPLAPEEKELILNMFKVSKKNPSLNLVNLVKDAFGWYKRIYDTRYKVNLNPYECIKDDFSNIDEYKDKIYQNYLDSSAGKPPTY